MLKVTALKYLYPNSNFGVKGTSFSLNQGKILSIIGKSGSGKSTLLKCIYGLYNLDLGKIEFNNERVYGPERNLIPGHKKMKLVNQEYELMPYHTVEENITHHLHLTYKSERKNRAKYLISLLDLKKVKSQLPIHLSGGQKQRVAIAQALASVPELLLLDEPFANLDYQIKQACLAYINKLKEEHNISIIIATHNKDVALSICDEMIVMQKGKFIQKGTADDIYCSPKNEYVSGLLGKYSLINGNFIRPEQIKTDDSGEIFEIINSFYFGDKYEYEAKKGEQIVTFYSPCKITSTTVKLLID